MDWNEINKKGYYINHIQICNIVFKKCTSCGQWKIMNTDNFYASKSVKIGFTAACRECTKSINKNHHRENYASYYKAYYKEWSDANRKHIRAKRKEYIASNPGMSKRWATTFFANNPDKLKEYGDKRKAKNHKISKQEWTDCKVYFDNSCAYCGLPKDQHYKAINDVPKLVDLHKEHVDDQGANDLSNCVPACQSCNSSKFIFTLSEWYSEDNPVYTIERYERIIKWITEDYKLYRKEAS